jgi:hypothetical protein
MSEMVNNFINYPTAVMKDKKIRTKQQCSRENKEHSGWKLKVRYPLLYYIIILTK